MSGQTGSTNFNPTTHGFHFVNTFANDFIPALDIRTSGLCGGMSYAALDFYHHAMPIPSQSFPPANGTVLHSFLYDRQVTSIVANLSRWIEMGANPGGVRNTEFFNWGLTSRLEDVKRNVTSGEPVVLGLQGDGDTGNHQVVAYAYDTGRYQSDLGAFREDVKISVYDCNHPDVIRTLVPDLANEVYHYAEGGDETWRTYYADESYAPEWPPAIPNANYPHDRLVHELVLDFRTGADDLRGGNDNVDLVLNVLDGTQQFYPNINLGARWISNYNECAEVVLRTPIPEGQIKGLVVSTTFSGGPGGDNWDMTSLIAHALGGGFFDQIADAGPKRFTGEDKTLVIPIRGVTTTPQQVSKLVFTFQTGGDDLRGVNDNLNITIHFRDGSTQRVDNVNGGRRWVDYTTTQVQVDLNRAVLPVDIVQIDLETTFGGGAFGDNWDMASVSVRGTGSTFDQMLVAQGPKRFTGDDGALAIVLNRPLSGEHFYTASASERDGAIVTYGFVNEGVAGFVYGAAAPGTTPLYRLVTAAGSHFYTASAAERDGAIANYGYTSEGVACFVYPSEQPQSSALYRLVTAAGSHFYTASAAERDSAIANHGYTSEGVACFVYGTQQSGTTPLYRLHR